MIIDRPKVTLVAAATENDYIGAKTFDGKDTLPWGIGTQKEDLKCFQGLTDGEYVIFGPNTLKTLPKKGLKGRKILLLSKNHEYYNFKNVYSSFSSLYHLMHWAYSRNVKNLFVCGGQKIYESFWYLTDEIFLTRIYMTERPFRHPRREDMMLPNWLKQDLLPTAKFPNLYEYKTNFKRDYASDVKKADSKNRYDYQFFRYVRRDS